MPGCVTAVLTGSAPAESISGLTVLSGKNTDSIAGSTQIFIKVSEHKTRPVKRAGSHNSRQRIGTGTGYQSYQASSHSTRQRGKGVGRSAPAVLASVLMQRQSGKCLS